jgi:hypothetical protein
METEMITGILLSLRVTQRRRKMLLATALFMGLLIAPQLCLAQATLLSGQTAVKDRERESKPASESKPAGEKTPLTDSERAELLQVIKNLQDRVTRLESQVTGKGPATAPDDKLPIPVGVSGAPANNAVASTEATAHPTRNGEPESSLSESSQVRNAKDSKDSQETGIYHEWGTYTPNRGFKIVSTEHGDLDISIYAYARYLNQRALDSTYKDAFGNTKSVQQRQDFQLQKVQIKFLGWIMSPKLRYFLYTWTSNASLNNEEGHCE